MTEQAKLPCAVERCQNWALPGATRCPWHGGRKELAELRTNGHVATPEVASEERPRGVREHLRRATDAKADLIEKSLFETLAATKTLRITCPTCKTRIEHTYPDASGRATAARTLVEMGHGRPRENREDDPEFERLLEATDVSKLDSEELEVLHRLLLRRMSSAERERVLNPSSEICAEVEEMRRTVRAEREEAAEHR